jgi:hypothetical protein
VSDQIRMAIDDCLRRTGSDTTCAADVSAAGGIVSEVDFLGDFDRIIDFDAEIPHGAFDFRVTQQQLDRAQIAGTAVDQYGLRAPQRMRAEFRRIKSNAGHPLLDEPSVLPSRQSTLVATACEEELTCSAEKADSGLVVV